MSQVITLFDGKILGADDTLTWENVGTGTGAYANNKYSMSVGVGQYQIRRSKSVLPYFSGKSTILELTFDGFGIQANVEKSVGYYTSSPVAPYNTSLDGFRLHNDGTTIRLQAFRSGVTTADIPWTSWDNYDQLSGYDWDNFTITLFDYLWLGGSELRLFIKTENGFVLAHTFAWASTDTDTFILTPNQTVRYEVRSSTGTGAMRYICAHAGTEGTPHKHGKATALYNTTSIATNTVGTIYALKSVKKLAAFRDTVIRIDGAYVANTGSADAGLMMIILNPTVSAPITYATNGKISEGTPTNQTITAGTGRVVFVAPATTAGGSVDLEGYYMSTIGMTIADVADEWVLAYMPITANQTVHGVLRVKEF